MMKHKQPFIETQVVNATLSKVQRMWLAFSRPAKKQATAESGIYKFRLYQSESQEPRVEDERALTISIPYF